MYSRYCVLDFETVDPYIELGLGAGWPYLLNLKEKSLMKIIGVSWRTHEMEKAVYKTWNLATKEELEAALHHAYSIIAHNAQYDFGILLAVGLGNYVFSKTLYDTKILAKLDNNTQPHSLGDLAQAYLSQEKGTDILIEAVRKYDLFPYTDREKFEQKKAGITETRRRKTETGWERYQYTWPTFERKLDNKKLLKWAYRNMDKIPFEFMEQYGMQDTEITHDVWQLLAEKHKSHTEHFSDLMKCVIQSRAKGVRIDLDQARKVYELMMPLIAAATKQVHDLAGVEFDIHSNKQVGEVLTKILRLKLPKTEKGNYSASGKVLESLDHPISKAIIEARQLYKLNNEFIGKLTELQRYTTGVENSYTLQYGRLYPEFQILGATATGRFSSASPNIQQIPARNKTYAPLCRSIFIPDEGKEWCSADYSNQEGRLQIHYAYLLNCKGAKLLVDKLNTDPMFDIHQMVADTLKISRSHAKTINLGLSYGMGRLKLAASLGLTMAQTKPLLDHYYTHFPYLKDLSNRCQSALVKRGYIKTINGRALYKDPEVMIDGKLVDFSYKALNKLIQGSAADQTQIAMVECYRAGIPILFSVHDELCLDISKHNTIMKDTVKQIMENSLSLAVPTVVDIDIGSSWGAAKFSDELIKKVLV